jgi:peroxiredoxin
LSATPAIRRVRVLVAAVSLLVMVATAPAACADPGSGGDEGGEAGRALLERRPLAPVFRVRTLTGERLDLDTLLARGPVVLDFWATWCKPCVASLPALAALHRREAGRGLSVLGISIDGPRNFARVRPFVNKLGLDYPNALDEDGSLQERFQVVAVPTTFVIGPDRRIVLAHTGWDRDGLAPIERALAALLPPDSSAAAPPDSGRAR